MSSVVPNFIDILIQFKKEFRGLADDLAPLPFLVLKSWDVTSTFYGICYDECAEAVDVNSGFLTSYTLFKSFPTLKYVIPYNNDWGEGVLKYRYSFALIENKERIKVSGVAFMGLDEIVHAPVSRDKLDVVGIGFPVFSDVMYDVKKFFEQYKDDPNWKKVVGLYGQALDIPFEYYISPYSPIIFMNENNYDGDSFSQLHGWTDLYDLLYTMKRYPTAVLNGRYFIITVPVGGDQEKLSQLLSL